MFGVFALLGSPTHADLDAGVLCREAKAKAAGKKASDLLKSFGRNEKNPVGRLAQDISKAQSKFTRSFSRAEARGGCLTSGDSDDVEARVDAFVQDVLAETSGVTSTTVTTTSTTVPGTTTTLPLPCGAESKCVFLTSLTWHGNLGGLDGADSKCHLAAQNGAPCLLGKEFRAWLSDRTTAASTRLSHSTVPYRLVDGTLVADDWDDLIGGELSHPIDITELNTAPFGTYYVWTGTNPDATIFNPLYPSYLCEDWTYTYWDTLVGNASSQDELWTAYSRSLHERMCDQEYRLYCFQQ